jgi:hypothetical protein
VAVCACRKEMDEPKCEADEKLCTM